MTDRLPSFFEGLCKTIRANAHAHGLEAALAWAAWNRVRLLGARLTTLAERSRDRKLHLVIPPRPAPGPLAPRSTRARCNAAAALPHEFGWLQHLLPQAAASADA